MLTANFALNDVTVNSDAYTYFDPNTGSYDIVFNKDNRNKDNVSQLICENGWGWTGFGGGK